MLSCPLCSANSHLFFQNKKRVFYQCSNCCGIFIAPSFLPDAQTEKARYLTHNNDVSDPRYQNFVAPITNEILNNQNKSDTGIDFGAGTGPVITSLLADKGYTIELYDPFFHNTPALLNKTYDFIICCEVIEHFHQPKLDFALLRKLLKPKGKLYCMTNLYNEQIDFKTWWYKNDITHVFLYHRKTMEWIKHTFQFKDCTINQNLIVLTA